MNTHNPIHLPLSGNGFITRKAPRGSDDQIHRHQGLTTWADPHTRISVWFKVSAARTATLALELPPAPAAATVSATIGEVTHIVSIEKGATLVTLGSWELPVGYVRVDLQGVTREGENFVTPTSLVLLGYADEEVVSAARPQDRDNFYWTRRGPSVHTKYNVDYETDDIEWFYNEMTVNPGEDPQGTYAMAIGFSGGYFGAQVTDKRKQLIFSIWSPHVTDNPAEIPEELRVKVLAKHDSQWIGDFGNEGSGSQSFMHYDWVSGTKYRYLMRVVPRENNYTQYTAYFFFPETGKWEVLASFLRPQTNTYLKGAHSFLESFIPETGYKYRRANYSNQWAVTKGGVWLPVDGFKFTADATARAELRHDYAGGVHGNDFYLANCGFFNDNPPIDSTFTRDVSKLVRPDIDLTELAKLGNG